MSCLKITEGKFRNALSTVAKGIITDQKFATEFAKLIVDILATEDENNFFSAVNLGLDVSRYDSEDDFVAFISKITIDFSLLFSINAAAKYFTYSEKEELYKLMKQMI